VSRGLYVCPPIWRIPGLADSFYAPGPRTRAEMALATVRRLQAMGVATPELTASARELSEAMAGGTPAARFAWVLAEAADRDEHGNALEPLITREQALRLLDMPDLDTVEDAP
jgi:hypothetical protein